MTTVCVITSIHHTYDGRIYYKQCRSLLRAGYRVKLVAPKPEEMEAEDGIEIIPFEKPKNRWRRLLNGLRIYRMAKKTNADLFHFHDPDLLPIGVLLRLATRKPVIYDVHEHYPNAIMGKAYIPKPLRHLVRIGYEWTEKCCLSFLTGVIYTTKQIGKRYEAYDSCKIENYPLKDMFSADEQIEKDPHLFIYLGGITEIRGVTQLIEAFSQVVRQYPRSKLLFVGFFESDKYEETIKSEVARLKIEENVIFQGRVPYTKINEYVGRASIGVLPYLPVPNHLVALPNKLIEYMAAGNAVIASDFPHYREIVDQSGAGLLVDPCKPEEMAEAMMFFLDHPDETNEMGRRAKSAFHNVYNWDHEERKLINFYEKIVANDS